jgi:hypothetical protein
MGVLGAGAPWGGLFVGPAGRVIKKAKKSRKEKEKEPLTCSPKRAN